MRYFSKPDPREGATWRCPSTTVVDCDLTGVSVPTVPVSNTWSSGANHNSLGQAGMSADILNSPHGQVGSPRRTLGFPNGGHVDFELQAGTALQCHGRPSWQVSHTRFMVGGPPPRWIGH